MAEQGLKRHFGAECARVLAAEISKVWVAFDGADYVDFVDKQVGPLELKDRVMVLAQGLRDRLPADYPEAVQILVAALGPEIGEGEGMFKTYGYLMPVARFVEEFGLEYPAESLRAIEKITRRHTGEFAIRPYLLQHYDLTMQFVRQWSCSESFNVRRLASEGIRPRLPWATRFAPFVADPAELIDVLGNLIADDAAYVRKSVANNLNDISRDHPGLAVEVARRWLRQSPTPRTEWIVRHGLRTLIKAGDPAALETVGAAPDPAISVREVKVTPQVVAIGAEVTLSVLLHNEADQLKEVIVDYVMHFRGKSGALRPKVYKMSRATIQPGETLELTKRHVFKKVRTRTYYPGVQKVGLQIGGVSTPLIEVLLEQESGASGTAVL